MGWPELDAERCLALILDNGLKSIVLLLCAWTLTLLLKKASAACRHFVWFAALAGISLLPLTSLLIPAWGDGWSAGKETQFTAPTVTTVGAVSVTDAEAIAQWDNTRNDAFKRGGALAAVPAKIIKAAGSSNWSNLILVSWCGGVLVLLLLLIAGLVKVRKMHSQAVSIDPGVVDSFKRASAAAGVEKPVTLLQSHNHVMPMTWGITQPAIILPHDFQQWPQEQQESVLLHELAHIKRKDCLMHLLGWCVCALYWFNPLAWFALRKMRVEREQACDDLVIERGAKASDYAEHLLQIARKFRTPQAVHAVGLAMARPSQLEGRLLAVLDERRVRRGISLGFSASTVLLFAAALVFVSGTRTSFAFQEVRSILFDHKAELMTGNNPSDIARGDLDGDGRADFVVVNYFADTLSILQNVSEGTGAIQFAEKIDIPTGKHPITAKIQDVDGDGKTDLVIANHFGKSIYIYRNLSEPGPLTAASFAPPVAIATEAGPCNAIAHDLNNDGKLDLLVANNGHAKGNTISIFENIGGPGELLFGERINLRVGLQPTFLRVTDFDGDNLPDIAVSNNLTYSLLFFRNIRGKGVIEESFFSPAMEFAVGQGQKHPYRLVATDVDGDGIPDLVVGSPKSLFIYRNTSLPGKFSFGDEVEIPSGSDYSVGLAMGDLNFDGKPDVAVGHLSTNLVSVFYNAAVPGYVGPDSFRVRQDMVANDGSSGVSIGDLDGDGRPDLAVANEKASTISVFRNVAERR